MPRGDLSGLSRGYGRGVPEHLAVGSPPTADQRWIGTAGDWSTGAVGPSWRDIRERLALALGVDAHSPELRIVRVP